jgi:hypothetical protein
VTGPSCPAATTITGIAITASTGSSGAVGDAVSGTSYPHVSSRWAASTGFDQRWKSGRQKQRLLDHHQPQTGFALAN